jgi:hypothetical protein
MADTQYDAQTRIQVLLEYLHDRECELEDVADSKRNTLDQCVQLRQLEEEAKQVGTWGPGGSGVASLLTYQIGLGTGGYCRE